MAVPDPAAGAAPAGLPSPPRTAGLIELPDLSLLPEGETDILSMNCTEPEEELAADLPFAVCPEFPGFTVLQLASRETATTKRVVFNILSTSKDIGTHKYSK